MLRKDTHSFGHCLKKCEWLDHVNRISHEQTKLLMLTEIIFSSV